MEDKDVSKLHESEIRGSWVQAERDSLEKLAHMNRTNPRAGTLLLILIVNMDNRGGLVASQKTLSELSGLSLNTVKRAIEDLAAGNWIETLSIGTGRGSVLAYRINSRVAWADKRDNLGYAHFRSNVIVAKKDQGKLKTEPLVKLPTAMQGEEIIPHGDGLPPPSQVEIEETLTALRTQPEADENPDQKKLT